MVFRRSVKFILNVIEQYHLFCITYYMLVVYEIDVYHIVLVCVCTDIIIHIYYVHYIMYGKGQLIKIKSNPVYYLLAINGTLFYT